MLTVQVSVVCPYSVHGSSPTISPPVGHGQAVEVLEFWKEITRERVFFASFGL